MPGRSQCKTANLPQTFTSHQAERFPNPPPLELIGKVIQRPSGVREVGEVGGQVACR